MTRPGDVKFLKPNSLLNNIDCKDGSLRDPDQSAGAPCNRCGHLECRLYYWEDPPGSGTLIGPYPCSMCNLIVYARAMFNRVGGLEQRADNGQDAIQTINTELGDHETRLTNQANAGQALTARVTTAETNIANGATAIQARPTNAQMNTAIGNAVNPVDTKVNTLKTRVDNATSFPIPP